jgi:hypothetical protein
VLAARVSSGARGVERRGSSPSAIIAINAPWWSREDDRLFPTRGDFAGTARKGFVGADMVYWTGCASLTIETAGGRPLLQRSSWSHADRLQPIPIMRLYRW